MSVMDTVGESASKQLGADLVKAAVDELKSLQQPWHQLNEDAQQTILDRLTENVRDAVRTTIKTLATRGHQHVVCELEQFTVKKGAKATLTIPKGSVSEELLDAVGQPVILVVASTLDDASSIQTPRADPDQPDLLANTHQGGEGGDDVGGAGVVHSDPED